MKQLKRAHDDFYQRFGVSSIEKRDGSFVKFDASKIKLAIFKAMNMYTVDTNDVNHPNILNILDIVNEKLSYLSTSVIHIEEIQRIVIESIAEYGYTDISKKYASFKNDKKNDRDIFDNRIIKLIDSYIHNETWKIKENSNMNYSLQGLNLFISSKISKTYWLKKIFDEKQAKHHSNGDIHIHDLYNLSAYCCGWDLKDLLTEGFTGCAGKISCHPPKHFDAAVGQIYNFLFTTQGEVAGAVSFSNVDTLLAPYIRRDNLIEDREKFKQSFQNFIYNLNVPTRVGFQCVSEDSEILTADGWKTYDMATIDDSIRTLNLTTNAVEDLPASHFCTHKHVGMMYRFQSEHTDQYVNAEHNTLVYDEIADSYELKNAKHLYKDLYDGVAIEIPYVITDVGDDTVINSIAHEAVTSMSIVFDYDGIIWCPTTDNQTIVVRRNGKTFVTGNSPFTNFALDLTCPKHMKDETVFIGGEDTNTVYGDYQPEIDAFNDMFCEIMTEGDKHNKVFSFPIPTYEIDDTFDWDNPNLDKLWTMTGKYGIPYFGNYINSDLDKEDFRSMCPLSKNEHVLVRDSRKEYLYDTIQNISALEKRFEIYSDGKFVEGTFNKYNNQEMINISLENGHEMNTSIHHLNFVKEKANSKTIELESRELTDTMYLPYSINQFKGGRIHYRFRDISSWEIIPYLYNGGDYNVGFIIGMFINHGAIRSDNVVEFYLYNVTETKRKLLVSSIENRFSCLCHTIKNPNKRLVSVCANSEKLIEVINRYVKNIEQFRHHSDSIFTTSVDFRIGVLDGQSHKFSKTECSMIIHCPDSVYRINMLAASLGSFCSVFHNNMMQCAEIKIIHDPTKNLCDDEHVFIEDGKMWVKIKELVFADEKEEAYCFEVANAEPMFTVGTTGILTHNCRLRLDTNQLNKRGGGLFGSGSLVGSLGVITINMPRIGHLASDRIDFFKRLNDLLEVSKDLLISKAEFIEFQTKNDFYPFSKFYLRNIYKRLNKYWANHFLTIGIIGVNEACINFLGSDIETKEGRSFALNILDFINKKLIKFQQDTDYLFNLEASPAEGTSYDLWCKDKELFPTMKCLESDNEFYTNSTFLPINSTLNLFDALSHQEVLQEKYTGGTVFHGFIGESLDNPKAVKNIVKTVLSNYKVPYFNITPTFSICDTHGYIKGKQEKCPECNELTNIYSRVVGYFSPTKNWNYGKQNEFEKRTLYDNEIIGINNDSL